MGYDATLSIGLIPDDSQLTRTLRNLETHAGRSVSKAIGAHTQPLGRITGQANEFQKSLAASNARVIAFGASTGIIFAMKSAFQQLVHATIDVQKEMTEVNAVFRLGGDQLKNFSNNLFSLANNYGVVFSNASKVAVEFARQGNNVEETLKKTSAALALMRISGLGLEESVGSLTSILNSFQKEGLNAIDVVNRLTAVDQNYAISAGELAEALSRVSSSASDANVSLNQTVGLITAAKQITGRTAGVLGNSFKTIFTRLQRPEVLDDLEAVGVKARDAEGKVRPMIDILKSLASTYDTLGASQKSFTAETVGGVYQINVLKAVMHDLGSGISYVDGAMRVAGESTGFVNTRMEVLNETISSQLIRTANNLKLAFSNIGSSLISGPLSTGLNNFDSALRSASKYTDPSTAKQGNAAERTTANFVQGGLKGLANFTVGPGLQFLATTLFKLFERLTKFIVESGKDLTGVTEKEKQREALNQGISEWLGKQEGLLKGILTGHVSLSEATRLYVESLKDAVANAQDLKAVTESIGIRAITQVTFTGKNQNAAEGYIPNLEISAARRGGYQAGRVMDTTINDGARRLNIIANGAETVSRVNQEGKSYDFINPPSGSPAGRAHRQESLRQTGIDPYALPNMSLSSKGFIPNLALSPDMVQTIINLGIDPKKIVEKARLSNIENFTSLPQDLVSMFVSRYRHDTGSLSAALVALTKKGANIPLNNGRAMANFLSGFMLNKTAKEKGLFPDMSSAAVGALTEAFTGQEAESPQAALAKIAAQTRIRPQDAQRILNLHSKSIPFIAGYESPNDLSDAKDRPNQVSTLDFPIDTGKSYSFRIETPIYGFKGNLAAHFAKIEALMKTEAESEEDFTPAEIGTTRGVFFDKKLRAMAKKEGVKVGEPGSSLDIYGPVRSILSKTSIKNAVAAMELKGSAVGAVDSGNMAEKLFRTFVGEPGGGNRKPVLKGPVGYVPKLTNIQQFNSRAGGIGIIDADRFGGSETAFNALIYAATASGKPLRIHYGPMTTGKTTAAENIVNKAGGLGASGGDYITDINQIDSDEFKQFIINKTDRKNLDTGVFGLALSAASQVRAFYSPYSEYKAKQEEMVKRLKERNRGKEGRDAEAISKKYDEHAWKEYSENIDYLEKKLGPERVSLYDSENPSASRGYIPNLVLGSIGEALKRENKATGGNAVISSHPMLRTNTNPLGLAAIDGRFQKDAGEAMHQHMSMGQSLNEVRSASTASKGYVPNLAVSSVYDEPFNSPNVGTYSSSGIVSSILLALAGVATKNELTGPKTRKDISVANGGWLSHFASDGEKAAAKLRVLSSEFESARASLHAEKDVALSTLAGGGSIGGKDPNKFPQLDRRAAEVLAPLREAAAPFQKALEEASRRASKIGIRTATIASLGGGVASQFASTISPSAGESVNEFSSGATQAGQFLLTFPGKFGWIGAIALAGGAAVSALNIFARGMANSIRDFEISHAHTETVNNQLDSLASAMNQYDTLITDSSASLSAIDTAQRDYAEALSQLKTSALGRIAASKLEAAPDTKSRLNTLIDFKQKNVRRDNLEQSLLTIEKYADRKKFAGSQSIFGIKPLEYRTQTEKTQVENSLRTGAGDFIHEMSSGLKNLLGSVSSVTELSSKLTEAQSNPDEEVGESAKELIAALNSLEEKIGKSATSVFKQNVVNQLQNEAADNTPERQESLNALRYRSAQRQTGVTNALNEARLRQRIFVNSGALNTQNQFNLRDVRNQARFNEALVGGSDSVARREANAGVYRQQFGERTVKTYETATEVKRISAEGQNKISQVRTDAARNVFSSLTQNFEQVTDDIERFKKIQAGGSTAAIPLFKERLLTGLNQGVTKTVSGDISSLRDSRGQLNVERVINKIVENSGETGSVAQDIKTYLQANVGSSDTLKLMLDAAKQEVAIQQETNTSIMRQGVALEGFMREMDFKTLANYMGGIRSLLDRNSRRTTQRNLVRGAFLMERGRTAEAKATGASLYLGALKDMQIPLDRTKNTALSRSIGQAFDTLIPNLAAVQRQMASQVANSSLVRGGSSGAALQELANMAGIATATAAAQAQFQPENPSLSGRAQLDISRTTDRFNQDLFKASSVLEAFALSVQDSLQKKQDAEKNYITIKGRADKEGAEDRKKEEKKGPENKGIDTQGQSSRLSSFGATVGPSIPAVLGAAGLGIGYFTRKAYKNNKQFVDEYKKQRVKDYAAENNSKEPPIRIEPEFKDFVPEAAGIPKAPEPPINPTLTAKEKALNYKQKQGQREHARKQARENQRVTREGLIEDFGSRGSPEVAENIRTSKATLQDKIKPSSKGTRFKFTKEPSSAFKAGGGKTALITGILALLATSAINQAQGSEAGQEGQEPEESKFTKPSLSARDVIQTGIDTGANAAIFKTPNISKLNAVKKGAVLAITGLVSDKLEETLGGGVGAQTAGAALNIGAAGTFFGPAGAAGAAIGIGSEKLRRNYTEKKFGYGAGVTQGFLGSVASGATFGAIGGLPGAAVGGAINGGLYLGAEALSVRGETKDAEAEGRMLDAKLKQLNAYRQSKSENSVKATTQNAKISGNGNDNISQDILKALQDINSTLTKSLTQPTINQTPQTSQIDSQINVDISVKDADKIPTEISTNIIGPLKVQLATLQQQVNELMNLNRPRPASA